MENDQGVTFSCLNPFALTSIIGHIQSDFVVCERANPSRGGDAKLWVPSLRDRQTAEGKSLGSFYFQGGAPS